MRFTSTVFTLLTAAFSVAPALSAAVAPVRVNSVLNYDRRFDDPKGTLSSTTCSAGVPPYKTFGEIPSFPRIAGSELIEGFNSTRCGACYELTYVTENGLELSSAFTIINSAPKGFIMGLEELKLLTGFDEHEIPQDIPISYRELPAHNCLILI